MSEFKMIVEDSHCARFRKLRDQSIQKIMVKQHEIQSRHLSSMGTKSSLLPLGYHGASGTALNSSMSLKKGKNAS